MKRMGGWFAAGLGALVSAGCGATTVWAEEGTAGGEMPKPTAEQAAWQEMEFIAFAHFGINTFTDREWGEGTEDPKLFNPTEFDARQWVRVLKSAGVKMLILTAKHHDGFCLWPSAYTEHSVKNSPWREGKGDVVREVTDACREGGIKAGIYLSPWDRHERKYGDSPAYNQHFVNQLRELLTNYGPVAEVWFDGACGEGPNGKKQEYDWASYYRLVREVQPTALIAICGPDIRWVGNESGVARPDESSVQPADGPAGPGKDFRWHPAECDVSIRPGWFYHAKEDGKVKSLGELMDIYYKSVGRNSVLLLNVPPDRRGLIHENDALRLAEFGAEIQRRFGKSVAEMSGTGTVIELSVGKRGDGGSVGVGSADQIAVVIDHVMLMEDIREGERVRGFVVEGMVGGMWKQLCKGKVIGHKRIERIQPTGVTKVRLRNVESSGEPIIRKLAVFRTGVKP